MLGHWRRRGSPVVTFRWTKGKSNAKMSGSIVKPGIKCLLASSGRGFAARRSIHGFRDHCIYAWHLGEGHEGGKGQNNDSRAGWEFKQPGVISSITISDTFAECFTLSPPASETRVKTQVCWSYKPAARKRSAPVRPVVLSRVSGIIGPVSRMRVSSETTGGDLLIGHETWSWTAECDWSQQQRSYRSRLTVEPEAPDFSAFAGTITPTPIPNRAWAWSSVKEGAWGSRTKSFPTLAAQLPAASVIGLTDLYYINPIVLLLRSLFPLLHLLQLFLYKNSMRATRQRPLTRLDSQEPRQ
jgi:hypothetical protein